MKQVTINLYSFRELNKEAQQKAITEHREFMKSFDDDYYEYDDSAVIDNIETNEYIYFEDGAPAHCTTYKGKHPKAGMTELKFHNSILDIT